MDQIRDKTSVKELTLSAPGYFCLIMPCGWRALCLPFHCVNPDREMLLT